MRRATGFFPSDEEAESSLLVIGSLPPPLLPVQFTQRGSAFLEKFTGRPWLSMWHTDTSSGIRQSDRTSASDGD